ncbi:hypothetical protein Vretimale_9098 [Volvox reticuliferus]|uniref:Cystatin domain-containing protein n=1 Tax=Volvox reticuliferus TaxID=1737510 RepID=A0A8J4CEA7_9CHLO|nr:hypothetical protein Vretifemale_9846 [Volvox reticuliferus]GIM04551.1 hypothetical protein Vretimale_9098 [Volvox reticuliferus]
MEQFFQFFFVLLLASGVFVNATSKHDEHHRGLGAVIEADVNDPAIKAAADYVTSTANKNNCNGLCASLKRHGNLRLLEIVSAKTQVVAGTLYKMELLLADEKGQQVLFTCSVWSRPWKKGQNGGDDEINHITKFHYQYIDP